MTDKTLLILATAVALGVKVLAAQQDSAQANPRARLLIDRGCSECHAMSALKMKGKADVGPDLSSAYAQVPFRYGMPLERFFDQPAGVMRIVLGGRTSLRPAERDSLVALFRDVYNEQLARLDSAQRRFRPVESKRRASTPGRRS